MHYHRITGSDNLSSQMKPKVVMSLVNPEQYSDEVS